MKLIIPSWMKINPELFRHDDPVQIGTSGGRTSALLAVLYSIYGDGEREYDFWNTGRENEGTYRFLGRLADHIPLRCFEVRKPLVFGDRPSMMTFEEVPLDRLDRTGKPFEVFMETIADYRRVVKGEGPIGPNPVQRLCTAYMKAKLSHHVAESRGWESWVSAVGLRADEPGRVAKISARDTKTKTSVTPLSDAGITSCMVENFWSDQPFDLEIPQHEGNCDACFLKNEAHLAQILSGPGDWDWWFKLDDTFQIRGRGEASYRTIQIEAPARFAIRESLVQIKALPERPDEMEPRRYRLLVAQEKKILREGIRYVPCSCEASELIDDDAVAGAQGVLEFA